MDLMVAKWDEIVLKKQLIQVMQDIWQAMRNRVFAIFKQPYEVIKQDFISEHEVRSWKSCIR